MHQTTEPRPLFVLAGMPRAGTTYFYHALAAHPGFYTTSRKELRFFSHHHDRGATWYARQFHAAPPRAVCADLSPDYFMHVGTEDRIAHHPGPVRVALAVREPAEWAVSLHRHLRSFEPGVPAFPNFLRHCRYPDFQWPGRLQAHPAISLVDGFVSRRLEEFSRALGPRLLLYDFASFERDPLGPLRAIERFVGIGQPLPAGALPAQRINVRSGSERRRLTYWLSREPVSNLMSRLLPSRLALRLRRQWETASRQRPAGEDAADLALARECLAPDSARVGMLFRHGPAVLGDGTVYAESTPRAAPLISAGPEHGSRV